MNDDGMFLWNSWYVAAWNHELIDGKKVARMILERPIVLYRGASGKVVALDDRCCHRAAPLSMGRIEGDDIRCMYHGMKFDPANASRFQGRTRFRRSSASEAIRLSSVTT